MHPIEAKCIKCCRLENLKERDHVEDLRIDRRIILKYIVNERWGAGEEVRVAGSRDM